MADTKQTYEIKLTVECDPVADGHPRDWLDEALKEGNFKYKTITIYGTETVSYTHLTLPTTPYV